MSGSFDAYHKWLGIPPDEQPPNHYRLLGVPLFESDADVIANAADRSMAHLRTFQSGQFAADSQRLLNEVAAARVCLLNAAKKAAYDQQLRATRPPAGAAPAPPRAQPVPVRPVAVAVPTAAPAVNEMDFIDQATTRPRQRRRRNQGSSVGGLIAFAVVAVGGVIGLVLYRSSLNSMSEKKPLARSTPKKAAKPSVQETMREDKPPGSPSGRKQATKAPIQRSEKPRERHEPSDDDTEQDPPAGRDESKASIDDDLAMPAETAGPREVSLPENMPFTNKEFGKRKPVPPESELSAARKTIRDLFDKDFGDLKTKEKRFALAKKLFQQGRETHDDLAARYELLDQSRQLSATSCAPQAVIQAVIALAESFEIDDVDLTVTSFETAGRATATPGQKRDLAEQSLKLVDEAMRRERYDAARKLIAIARAASIKAADANLQTLAATKARDLKDRTSAQDAVQQALAILAEKPDDAAANLVVGKQLCLVDRDWQKGLPMLAQSSDEAYRSVAHLDLAGATDAAAQVAIGDAWLAIPETNQRMQDSCRERAEYWYKAALPKLTGLQRVKVLKAIKATNDPVGNYRIKYTGPESGEVTMELRGDNKYIQDGEEVGTWSVDGEKIVIEYSDRADGGAVLQWTDADHLTGLNRLQQGGVYHWQIERVKN